MQRFFMIVAVVAVMMIGLASAAQAESKSEGFTGIWQAVDDGILVTADISDVDGDGQFRYRVNFDFHPACNKPGELGRALVTPLAPATVNAESDLVMDIKITCLLTERIIEESATLTLRLIDDNTLLNVTRDTPFQRISAPRK